MGIDSRDGYEGSELRKPEGFFASSGPLPSQQTLSAATAGALRVRVIRGGMVCDQPVGRDLLFETDDRVAIAGLLHALRIVEGSAGHCDLCLGDPTLVLETRDQRRVTLGVHHGTRIRWEAWSDDAKLTSEDELLNWFAREGITYPRDERRAAMRLREAESQAARRWVAAMPACFERFSKRILDEQLAADPSALMAPLQAAFPDTRDQALALFEWLGHGEGSWSGYPAYECVPERLLLCMPFSALSEALRARGLTPAQLEGAARFFAGWQFRCERRADAMRLAHSETRELLEHALRSGDPDKQQRAQKAFAQANQPSRTT
jgi:hypothetical protein